MFENIIKFFNKIKKKQNGASSSKDTAKERLHLVLMQDRANVSADFLDLMRQEIIDVIKKYIEVDESAIDVRLTNKENEDGTNGAPALYANIPILSIKEEAKKEKENFGDGSQNLKKQKDEGTIKTENLEASSKINDNKGVSNNNQEVIKNDNENKTTESKSNEGTSIVDELKNDKEDNKKVEAEVTNQETNKE